jgi:hypothetical protein
MLNQNYMINYQLIINNFDDLPSLEKLRNESNRY